MEETYSQGEEAIVNVDADAGDLTTNDVDDDESPQTTTEAVETQQNETKRPAHFFNPNIHTAWRYGILTFSVLNMAFLLVCDISSGVVAKTQILNPDGTLFEEQELITVSIFSSVGELWHAESYFLAIFICLASVLWPYLKLLCTIYAWVWPFKIISSRERFIEIVDALDKWSFVDIFVLIIIMVSFRLTINAGAGVMVEVYILPKWGFYGFVAANMMSLMATQAVLYQHRQIQYHTKDAKEVAAVKEGESPTSTLKSAPATCVADETGISKPILVLLFVACIALHVVGCGLDIYQVSNTRFDDTFIDSYSVYSTGIEIAKVAQDGEPTFGMRWIQFMYFLFAVALPVWNTMLFAVLYFLPITNTVIKERVFFLTEITFSWAAVEVYTLSVIFSILQIPKFGNGLIDAGCSSCYVVDSQILPAFAVLCISTALNVVLNIYLFLKAHSVVFAHNKSAANDDAPNDAVVEITADV